MKATEKGEMNVAVVNRFNNVTKMALRNVLFVPRLRKNLMSEDRITAQGFQVLFTHYYADVIEQSSGDILAERGTDMQNL